MQGRGPKIQPHLVQPHCCGSPALPPCRGPSGQGPDTATPLSRSVRPHHQTSQPPEKTYTSTPGNPGCQPHSGSTSRLSQAHAPQGWARQSPSPLGSKNQGEEHYRGGGGGNQIMVIYKPPPMRASRRPQSGKGFAHSLAGGMPEPGKSHKGPMDGLGPGPVAG